MLRKVDLTQTLLPWCPSAAEQYVRVTRTELDRDLTDFSNRLWLEAGVAVPAPVPAAAALLVAGRSLAVLGYACALGMLLLAASVFVLAALDLKDAATGALLATCGAAVLSLTALAGAAITA